MKASLLILFLLLYPLSSKAYSHLSPYAFCGDNPVNYVDPTGDDIVVLNFGDDIGHQHLAMLIQTEDGKWQYYSVNGNNMYIFGNHTGGREFNDIAVGSWDSPQEFLDSSYNVRNKDSKDKKDMNHFGFSEGYLISTTPEQDTTMRNSFSKTAETEYNLFTNNCATAVQKAMVDAGIPVSEPTWVPSSLPLSTPFGIVEVSNGPKMQCEFKVVPTFAFKSIIKFNPGGQLLHKNK